MTMRAWQVRSAGEPTDVLALVDVEPPAPGPGQMRIRVGGAGIGLPDVLMCRGSYLFTPPTPFTPGQEAAGTVTAVGPGVDTALGTRVMGVTAFVEGHGSFAEECLLLAPSAFPVPPGLDDVSAAGFWIPHMTAWIGLVNRGHVGAGDRLAVLGAAGGTGAAGIQLGRALGAEVIAVVSSEERAAFCRELGADVVVVDAGQDLTSALHDATDGHGVDVVYDPVGGTQAGAAARALRRDGRVLAVGFASGSWVDIATHDLVVANTAVVGVYAGGYTRAEMEVVHQGLSELVTSRALHNAVTAEIPFEALDHALQRLADRTLVGKAVLLP